jgi:hypothetical protein
MEILAVVTRMEGAHGDHEPESIHRGDFASAPFLGSGNVRLGLDQTGIRPNQSFSSDIVLLHPGESRRCEGRYFGAHQWLQADIACFGHEDCADAQGEIPDATSAFANVSELVAKPVRA